MNELALPAAPPVRPTLDRAAHHRSDPAWLESAWQRAQVVVVDNGRALFRADGPQGAQRLVLLDSRHTPAGERHFMGVDAMGTPYFAVVASHDALEPQSLGGPVQSHGVREVLYRLGSLDADLLLGAVALVNWHDRHRFSPSSGRPTTVSEGGWVRCDDQGELFWPRTDPAVIVLVHDGAAGPQGRCLLGRNAGWLAARPGDVPRFSCLAGFVEPGETLEQTLVREVAEEVGVSVHSMSYVASQPWPYPGSVMIGFHAVADPDEPLHLDPAEIAEARWFTRAQVNAAIDGTDTTFGLPSPSSIAYYLIVSWLRG